MDHEFNYGHLVPLGSEQIGGSGLVIDSSGYGVPTQEFDSSPPDPQIPLLTYRNEVIVSLIILLFVHNSVIYDYVLPFLFALGC